MDAPVVRLHLFFARASTLAVILRQGPTRHMRMILWDTRNDSFTDGQWTKQKVYVDRCAISPDGRHFLYFMLDGRWHTPAEGAYTAISRPPYWTALALFPEGSTWGGGGVFLDAAHFVADGGDDVIGRAEGLTRVYRREPTHRCRTGLQLGSGAPAPLERAVRDKLLELDPPYRLGDAGLDAQSQKTLDRYDTQGGRLYRRTGGDIDLIRDFTEMAFEPVRAPYDWRDLAEDGGEARTTWHPLDREGG